MDNDRTKKKDKVPFFLAFAFIFFMILPSVSAVTLDDTTVLNTTQSNSSITFNSYTVTALNVTVNPTSIVIEGANFTDGTGWFSICPTITHNTENTNYDSGQFQSVFSCTQRQNVCQTSAAPGIIRALQIFAIIGLIIFILGFFFDFKNML